tara:strand:- start:18 stop:239 length:222 start_codon:yes stop_codon:yes gene_type:complete
MNIKLKPETKTIEIQVIIKRIDWPRSGWKTRNKTIKHNKKKDMVCAKFKLLIRLDVIICAIIKMKKGFINSTG